MLELQESAMMVEPVLRVRTALPTTRREKL
jgi:hypothetical protein